jgi:hypothetical protein
MGLPIYCEYRPGERNLKIYGERIINGDIDSVWRISTDVNAWPSWDPHEESAELHGPFAVGIKGASQPRGGPSAQWVLTRVEDKKLWSLINKMPVGTLDVENRYEVLPNNKVRCERTMIVSGLLVPLFWIHFAKLVKEDMQATWQALEKEVAKQSKQQ